MVAGGSRGRPCPSRSTARAWLLRDGYAADLLLLRDAGDPALRAAAVPTGRPRSAACSAVLPTCSTRSPSSIRPGQVVASTDPTIVAVQGSAAFRLARANGSVGSSVDVPALTRNDRLRRPADGAGTAHRPGCCSRASRQQRIWAPTLDATVDGSRNVIVDADGTLIAGRRADELGRAWNAAPARRGRPGRFRQRHTIRLRIERDRRRHATSTWVGASHRACRHRSLRPRARPRRAATVAASRRGSSRWSRLPCWSHRRCCTSLRALAVSVRRGAASAPGFVAIEARLDAIEARLEAREA